ncbi:serine protease [Anabaena sp. UHCC 0451]|uniref:S1 family peptidase n=1 Tax=Anabaena sp. UHCC 0451 TaxID=2055235 RepID=UPI002B20B7F6|nr:serine protease [Anabaena sp. UHCC 0451]MEA5575594.1 serine protease [Anabaena sp. UHCC 0451]
MSKKLSYLFKLLDFNIIKLITCVSGLSLLLSTSTANIGVSAGNESKNGNVEQLKPELSQTQLKQQGKDISVKVLSTEFLGSAILLKKQDNIYTVLTNAHVLAADKPPYKIVTPDGKLHKAEVSKTAKLEKYDLGILEFSSTENYAVAVMGEKPKTGDEVFVFGFPINQENSTVKELTLTTGKIALVLEKALEGGYQIGYTNQLDKGMSGGPLLNKQGELVGVNGMHAFPIWDNPSTYIDGTPTTETLHQQIIRLSWAVPIKKLNIKHSRSQSQTGNAKGESLTHNMVK